jgi:hypothetical protein
MTSAFSDHARHGACIVAVIVAMIVGCSKPPPPPPPPPARPIVLSTHFVNNTFEDNQMIVSVRNDGQSGLVCITVNEMSREFTEQKESGVEKIFRETFTRNLPPQLPYLYDDTRVRTWTRKLEFAARESQTITISLPRHSSWSNTFLTVHAAGCWK